MTRIKLVAAGALALALGAPLMAQQWQMPGADDAPGTQTAPREEPFVLPAPAPDRNQGDGDLERDLNSIMDGVFQRLQPHLEGLSNELSATVDEFSPALNQLSGLMDDIGNYERPERLPNGDIVIRRRADAPPPPPLEELQRLLPDDETAPSTPQMRPVPSGPQTDL